MVKLIMRMAPMTFKSGWTVTFSRLFGPQDSFVRTPFQSNGTIPGSTGFLNPFPDGYSLPNVDFQLFEDAFNEEDTTLEEDISIEDAIDLVEDFTESSGANDASIDLQAIEDIGNDVENIIEGISEAISSSAASVFVGELLLISITIIEVFWFE